MRRNHDTTDRNRRGRRARAALGALAAVAAGAGLAAGPGGSADAATMSVYLHPVQIQSGGVCTVRVGLDIAMSQADANAFIAHPGEEATVKLWADDPIWDNAIIALPTDAPTWPQASASGYSVEFVRTMSCHLLDEDWRDDEDELFARITFNDFRTGKTQTASSNMIIKDFSLY